MAISCVRCGTVALTLLLVASTSFAVPVPAAKSATIKDRANYIPKRKHVPLPGKIIAILLPDAQAILNLEGRSGPANQLCIGYNGGSYRWVYVQVKERPMVGSLMVRVGDKGDRKRFDSLSLATPETVKQFGIKGRYALVEVEVNGGLGSPADDSFVATKMRQLDDTKEFPFKLDDVIANVRQQYDQRVKDQVRETDSGMAKAATEAIKDRKATGPRERAAVMFVTWLPDAKRLRVHFRTTISDGEYKYAGGVNIYLGGARTMKANASIVRSTAKVGSSVRQYGLRYGTQFGIDFGTAYEVASSGKIEKTLTLPIASFTNEIKEPPIFNRGAVGTRAFRGVSTARIRR